MERDSILKRDNLLLLICTIFLTAFLLVLLFRASFASIDLRVNSWVPSIQSSFVTDLAIGLSDAFGTFSLLAISLGVAAILCAKKHYQEGLLLLGAMGGATLIVEVIKVLVHSARPPNGLITDLGFSFPSGHTTGSIVFCGLLACFAWQRWKKIKPRIGIAVLTVTTTSVVGFDRIYLNVHWFSDVLGGTLLAVFWLTFSILLLKYWKANVASFAGETKLTSGSLLSCFSMNKRSRA